MDPIAAIAKLLTETVGEAESTKVVESLKAFKVKIEEDADKATKLKITEAINETKVKLETQYLGQLEKNKAEADKKIAEEVSKYEVMLAKRVKTVIEAAIVAHGDRLAKIAEENAAHRGSKLLKEVEALIGENKAPKVAQDTSAIALRAELAQVKEALEQATKKVMEATARKNVAESNLKSIKEELEQTVTVTVTEKEIEPTKAKPAAEEHADSQPTVTESVVEKGHTPAMINMRRLAGIDKKKK